MLFNGYRNFVWGHEKVIGNVPNATELYMLKWQILCYINLTTVKKWQMNYSSYHVENRLWSSLLGGESGKKQKTSRVGGEGLT